MVKKQILGEESTRKIGRMIREFMDVIEANNDDYAFIKGEIYSENNFICLDFEGSDIDGRKKNLEMLYDPENNSLSYSKRFSMINEDEAISAIVKFVSRIERFNPPVSKMRFDNSLGYGYAQITPSTSDPGCVNMLVVSKKVRDAEGREISLD